MSKATADAICQPRKPTPWRFPITLRDGRTAYITGNQTRAYFKRWHPDLASVWPSERSTSSSQHVA